MGGCYGELDERKTVRRRKPDPWRDSVRFALAVRLRRRNGLTGIAIAALAIAALARFAVWEERLNLIVGLWAFASPWVLGFQGTAMTVHVIIGAVVAILAAIELWMLNQIPPRLTTGR